MSHITSRLSGICQRASVMQVRGQGMPIKLSLIPDNGKHHPQPKSKGLYPGYPTAGEGPTRTRNLGDEIHATTVSKDLVQSRKPLRQTHR